MTLRLSCLTLAALLLFGGVALAKPQIAILGLEVIDKSGSPTPADAQVAEELTQQLRARAKTSGPYSLAPNGEKELIDQKLIKQCDDEKPTCMQSMGRDLAADFLMYGHIEKQNNAYQVTMFVFDVARKTREKTYPETIPLSEASGPALAGWARKIYGKLTGQSDACVIVVKTNGVDAGTILVNGAPKGSITNGVGQVNGLSEGRYKIAVEAKDYHRWEKSDVTCSAGQTTNVPAEMERIENDTVVTTAHGSGNELGVTGSTSRASGGHKGLWRDIAVIGAVGAVAGGGLMLYGWTKTNHYGSGNNWVFGTGGADGGPDFTTTATSTGTVETPTLLKDSDCGTATAAKYLTSDPSAAPPKSMTGSYAWANSAFQDACRGRTLTEVGGVITGAFAVAAIVGIVMYLHTPEEEEPPVNVTGSRHKRRRPPIAIVPVANPDGAGVTFSMQW
jgi:hypothetical protein